MKNILIKQIGLILLLVIALNSCEDSIEGINQDPLAAINIDPALLFPQVIVSGISQPRTVEGNAVNMIAQQWSSIVGFGVFINPERYIISPNTTNNLWIGNYTTGLRNLQQVRALTERDNPSAINIIGQAKILEAFIYLNTTLFFEDIPFNEAIQVQTFPNPNFDTQETVLRALPDLIDEGLEALATPTDIVEGGDLIYGGDRENWIRFGNSLKLKILMLIANVDSASVQAAIQSTANQPLISTPSQVAKLDYTLEPENGNGIWKLLRDFNGSENDFWGGGAALLDIMNANNDPRRATYFDDVDGAYVPQLQGETGRTGFSPVSLNIIRPEMPDIYASAAETNFYLAEAALKGWISGDANTFYVAGIQASLDFYDGIPGEISASDKTMYLSSPRGTITGDSEADALRKIHEEIYISNFTRGLEAWTNWRRNKVPNFEIPEGSILGDENIRRYNVPLSELTTNPNAPQSLPALDVPMWFENE
ncbi:SusD/RagB family nutrient-binding outer membrane lipoprotein [uncultured Algibacter sp.]|uniref:SusD/RagB family nutrient-binding outer membrane lipoprotein n=1 Tax=uncultured Algibacter sp. TaxID=298659 RepID=UPI003217F3B5